MADTEIRFEILEDIGLIAVTPNGWEKRLKIIRWNDGTPKFDIRDWSPKEDRMSKGITLRQEELKGLFKLLLQQYGKGVRYVEPEEETTEERDTDLFEEGI